MANLINFIDVLKGNPLDLRFDKASIISMEYPADDESFKKLAPIFSKYVDFTKSGTNHILNENSQPIDIIWDETTRGSIGFTYKKQSKDWEPIPEVIIEHHGDPSTMHIGLKGIFIKPTGITGDSSDQIYLLLMPISGYMTPDGNAPEIYFMGLAVPAIKWFAGETITSDESLIYFESKTYNHCIVKFNDLYPAYTFYLEGMQFNVTIFTKYARLIAADNRLPLPVGYSARDISTATIVPSYHSPALYNFPKVFVVSLLLASNYSTVISTSVNSGFNFYSLSLEDPERNVRDLAYELTTYPYNLSNFQNNA